MQTYAVFASADMNAATIGSMRELGITESYKLKRQVVNSASEAAEMILRYALAHSHLLPAIAVLYTPNISCHPRVDTILRATPRKREAM